MIIAEGGAVIDARILGSSVFDRPVHFEPFLLRPTQRPRPKGDDHSLDSELH